MPRLNAMLMSTARRHSSRRAAHGRARSTSRIVSARSTSKMMMPAARGIGRASRLCPTPMVQMPSESRYAFNSIPPSSRTIWSRTFIVPSFPPPQQLVELLALLALVLLDLLHVLLSAFDLLPDDGRVALGARVRLLLLLLVGDHGRELRVDIPHPAAAERQDDRREDAQEPLLGDGAVGHRLLVHLVPLPHRAGARLAADLVILATRHLEEEHQVVTVTARAPGVG